MRQSFRKTKIKLLIVAGVAIASGAVAVAVGAAGSSASGSPASAPPQDLLDGLSSTGDLFQPASPADFGLAAVTTDQAIQTAVNREVGGNAQGMAVHAYLGRLTQENRLEAPPADTPPPTSTDSTPPLAVNRLSYAVQIVGVTQYPDGPIGYTPDPSSVHHEIVVFIDAATGKEILSNTFR